MSKSLSPFLAVYVVWHPNYEKGEKIADAVRRHFVHSTFKNAAGGVEISVIYRFEPDPNLMVPLEIDLADAETTAIVVLCEASLTGDTTWSSYVKNIAANAHKRGFFARIFPVSIETSALDELPMDEQALRWDLWSGSLEQRQQILIGHLTHQFCRMLRNYYEHLSNSSASKDALEEYIKPIQIFLSHSKHDERGVVITKAIRDRINEQHALSTFFDQIDIPPGVKFSEVLNQKARTCAVIAIYTDSYSSRKWCRSEVIEAKLANVPLVVADCISNFDDRIFPYLGNVPLVLLDHENPDRIDFLIHRLLDEIFKFMLWRCKIDSNNSLIDSDVMFMPRSPELISLAVLRRQIAREAVSVIVYPDPPLSSEEERLFSLIAPQVRLRSILEWTVEKMP